MYTLIVLYALCTPHVCFTRAPCDFQGLKTGMYYLRTKPATQAIQFTVDKSKVMAKSSATKDENMAAMMCSIDNKDACVMCSG